MEGKVEIKADLTKTLDLLCDKLGLVATEVIPHYTKIYFVCGISHLLAGILSIVLPFGLFLIKMPAPTESNQYALITSPEGMQAFWLFLKIIPCFIFTAVGIYTIRESLDNIFAAKGNAISKLINQISNLG